jgi:hypothetical protein
VASIQRDVMERYPLPLDGRERYAPGRPGHSWRADGLKSSQMEGGFNHKERSAAKPQPISWAFRCLNTVGSQGRCAEFYLLKGATALKRVL